MTHILSAADMHLGKNTQRPWLRIIVSKTESKSNRHVISNNFLEKNFSQLSMYFLYVGIRENLNLTVYFWKKYLNLGSKQVSVQTWKTELPGSN